MYKIYTKETDMPKGHISKLLLIMRLTTVILIASFMQVYATGFAQKISMSKSNAPLKTVLKELRLQSGYNFVYTDDLLSMARPVYIKVTEAKLEDVLIEIFKEQPLTYTVNKNTITVKEKDKIFSANVIANTIELKDIVIRGKVTDAKGETLPGVSVKVKGTTMGTSTDVAGNYSLSVNENATLIFSYIGYVSKEVAVNNQSSVDIVLELAIASLNEIVVTALGIERESKTLAYSTQKVSVKELTEARELNVINALQGKVAGLTINSSGSGVGAPTRVILRGNRSISGNSQPLYVIDGVPVSDPNDINPDNIASLNVLKGPNAAALYGSAAQNGVIIIETKKGKAGNINVSLNHTTQVLSPIHSIQFQNEYAQGVGGVYAKVSESSWGPKMTGQTVPHWSLDPSDVGRQYALTPQSNNVADAFQNGFNTATNLYASMGSEKIQGTFSLTRTDAKGTMPGNTLARNNIAVRLTSQLSNKLSLDTKLDYMYQETSDPLLEDINNLNPVKQAYMLPRNITTADAIKSTYVDGAGVIRQNFWNPGSTLGLNPYFVIDRTSNSSPRQRGIVMSSLSYDFTNALKFMVRGSYDGIHNNSENKISKDFYSRFPNGQYSVSESNSTMFNADFLMSYKKKISNDWDFSANAGGNMQKRRNNSVNANTGTGMIVPDFWTVSNSLVPLTSANPGPGIDVNSVYGFAHVGWKDAIFLDITGRNDWSSTLPAANRSYFYPSVGLSVVLSDLIPQLPASVSFAKLRASWAKVGSGGPAYQLNRTASFSQGGNNGFVTLSSTLPNADLRPEETNSYELGFDISMFGDRLSLNATGYKTNTLNQLFTLALPPGSGASSLFTNGGDVENKGVELVLSGMPLRSGNFSWETNVNFSRNRNIVNKLNDERPKLIVGSDQSFRDFVVIQGQPFGEIYSIGYKRDAKGNVIVGSNGVPLNTGSRNVSVANANPDWMGGLSNSFSYKNLNFSFLIDHRQGGTVISVTNAMLNYEGQTKATLEGRSGGLVFGENLFPGQNAVKEDGTPNNIEVNAQTFWRSIGGTVNPIGEAFVENMTNTRLREVTLGYTLPKSLFRSLPISQMKLSLVGRNLFFIDRASKDLDPDLIVGTSVTSEGQSSFAPPSTRSFGLNLKMDFK